MYPSRSTLNTAKVGVTRDGSRRVRNGPRREWHTTGGELPRDTLCCIEGRYLLDDESVPRAQDATTLVVAVLAAKP
jgi:hypothetical protein